MKSQSDEQNMTEQENNSTNLLVWNLEVNEI